jgi:hypothetical protein
MQHTDLGLSNNNESVRAVGSSAHLRLNLGCGRSRQENMVNVDIPQEGHQPDVVLDLNLATKEEWIAAFGEDNVQYAQFIHVIEHITNHLQMMENLWHVMEADGIVYIRCPHGASDDAWEDPTHVRPIYPGSFGYYGQPYYWRADYGYRGDFRIVRCDLLMVTGAMVENPNFALMSRNSVQEMVVTLQAVKPAREPDRELIEQIPVNLKVAQ